MRNIFDQYSQPENRLTHALVCTLNADRSLIRPFLRWAGAKQIPKLKELRITQQQVPGEMIPGDEEDSSGLPDACIFTDDGWVMLIEAKVQAGIVRSQIDRHFATAKRYGFESPYLVLLSVDRSSSARLPKQTSHRFWRDLYCWLRERSRTSHWARTLAEYMEAFESRMIADNYSIRGTLTMFDGLRFDSDNPYTYREGKRLIRLLGDELRKRKDLQRIGMDPKGAGRPAITGQDSTRVWDVLPLKVARGHPFFKFPHLTMAIARDWTSVSITVPNAVRGGLRSKLRKRGEDSFFQLLQDVERRLRPLVARSKGARPLFRAMQRHYRSQRSEATVDAKLEADIRTVVSGRRKAPKYQPEWGRSVYEVITHKQSNIQLQLNLELSYACPIVRSQRAVDLFAEGWIAMSPIIDFILED